MNFKDLYNQKNKNELLQKIEDETFDRITISFYKYTKLKDLEILRNKLYLKWKKLNILGRVYIAPEGINAQISIPKDSLTDFESALKNTSFFHLSVVKSQKTPKNAKNRGQFLPPPTSLFATFHSIFL